MAKKGNRKKSPARMIFGWILFIAAVLAVLVILIPLVGATVDVSGSAMSPAVNAGDRIAVNRLAYLLTNPKRGDVIQFRSAQDAGTVFLRRVVALPGETVQIRDGSVYINQTSLPEPYASGILQYAGTAAPPLTLSEDEYFVMSDNRSNNFDSRDPTVGTVKRNTVSGKAWLKVLPFREFRLIL